MSDIIKNRAVVENDWSSLQPLPLAQWLEKVDAGQAANFAVILAPEDDPQSVVDALKGQINALPLIALHFPKFTEGRGFSTAYLLRQRYGYQGDIRAFGDIGRDHLWQLARVGVSSFDLRPGTDLHDALAAFADFPERYQTSVDEALPLFRRRQEAAHV